MLRFVEDDNGATDGGFVGAPPDNSIARSDARHDGFTVGSGVSSLDGTQLDNRKVIEFQNLGSEDVKIIVQKSGDAAPASGDFGSGEGTALDVMVLRNGTDKSINCGTGLKFYGLSNTGNQEVRVTQLA